MASATNGVSKTDSQNETTKVVEPAAAAAVATQDAAGAPPNANADAPKSQPVNAVQDALNSNDGESKTDASPLDDSNNPDSATSRPARNSIDDASSGTDNLSTFTARRSRKYQDPAIIFPDVDGVGSYKTIMDTVGTSLTVDEKQAMEELLEYLTSPDGGAWALGSPHLDAIGRLLNDKNFPDEIPVMALRMLQAAALKEDVILLLHQDREHHHVMSYLYRIENVPVPEQEEIATFMCNLCSNTSSFDWLMYISEWAEDGKPCNNSKVTVRVAVHSLLSNGSKNLQDKGSALIYNLALKELFDDVATELAMALLQFLQFEINEEFAFRALTALQRFMAISYNEVPALMKMLGPDVRKFSSMSDRVNQLTEDIHTKLSVSLPM